jgi:hypothetical protein
MKIIMNYFKKIIPVIALTVFLGFAGVVDAQGTTTPSTPTPTAPNTGAGGEAPMNLAILGASGAVALFGAAYLISNRRVREE